MTSHRDAPPWRQRAEEARTIAEQMRDPDARFAMLRIADNYDALARAYESAARVRTEPSVTAS